MGKLETTGDEVQEVVALVGRPVVSHDGQRREFAGPRVQAVVEEGMTQQLLSLGDGRLDGGDGVARGGRAKRSAWPGRAWSRSRPPARCATSRRGWSRTQ
jgi:hypothetical protein